MILEKVYDELMAQIEDLKKAVAAMSGATDDYDDLNNRPKVNNITLTGNKKSSDLKIAYSMTEAEYASASKNAESIYCLQENATSFEEEDETASNNIEWSSSGSGYVATWEYTPSNQNFTGCTAVECDDATITVEEVRVVEGDVLVFLSCEDTTQIGGTVTFTFTLSQPAGITRIVKNGIQFGGFQIGSDETVIGTWIDGRPLYAKFADTSASMTGSTWADITTITGAKFVVQLSLFVIDENGNTSYPALASINPSTGKIEGMHFRATTITFSKALVIYTK